MHLPIRYRFLRSSRFAAALAVIGGTAGAQAVHPPTRPTLIVFLTVDQMRAEYVDQWSTQLSGGLARLAQHGAVFTNAYHDHAVTETAPGHSVVMSGRFPRSTGILRNTAGVGDPPAPLRTWRHPTPSPYRLRGSLVQEWVAPRAPRRPGWFDFPKDLSSNLPIGPL